MKPLIFWMLIGVAFLPVRGQCQPGAPQIIRIVEEKESGASEAAEPLLFFADGRVGRLPPGKRSWLRRIRLAFLQKKHPVVQLDPQGMVRGLRLESLPPPVPPDTTAEEGPYRPTLLSAEDAGNLFHNMNSRSRRRAQCYNRAHVWAYEAFRNQGLFSQKVFLFFTLKYIREYRYRWWFHVAPLARVTVGDSFEEKVLDPIFMDHPAGLREWSDQFIRPKTACTVVERYSEYERLQNRNHCVFIKAPMYFWQPRDLEALERGGGSRRAFLPDEISYAYWQAFY